MQFAGWWLLYHDDVGASKIGGFDNGDKVVVCLIREFIDDSELHGDSELRAQVTGCNQYNKQSTIFGRAFNAPQHGHRVLHKC